MKSIKIKLLLTILGVAFGFSFILFVVTISQLNSQKSTIQEQCGETEEHLSENTQEALSELNQQVARDFSSVCNKYFNQSFKNIRKNVVSISKEMTSLYHLDRKVPMNTHVGLVKGTDKNDVRKEFGRIAPIRRFIKHLPSYDPKKLQELDLYVMTESGMCLDGTYTSLGDDYPDLREENWYIQAKKQKDVYWSGVVTGKVTGEVEVVCAIPVYDRKNRFRGCAAGDVSVEEFQKMLEEFDEKAIDSLIFFDSQSELMYATNEYRNVENVKGYLGKQEIVDVGNEIYSFSTLDETGWTICLVLNKGAMDQTTSIMVDAIRNNAKEITDIVRESIRRSVVLFVIVVVVGALLVLVITNSLAASFVRPIRQLMAQVEAVGTGDLEQVIVVNTKDEIGQLAEAFNQMVAKLKEYMNNLQLMTSDKERMVAEADVARQIQNNMLPATFPAFPERSEFDIYAMLRSVVGGGSNFYDFFMVDKSHFCIVIGDVVGSGGVPAAMYAIVTRTHIKNYAKVGYRPDRILVETNNQLSENNELGITVSVFIAIVDLLSGNMQYVNAGAPSPLWKHSGADFEVLPSKTCFALANMGNVPYAQQTVRLSQGDMLFLYTKGVPETVDVKGNEYTEEYLQVQMDELLEQEYQLEGLLNKISRELEQFSGDIPQKQDGTMVVFRYFGKG